MMAFVRSDGCDLYYEQVGQGVPILLIHPAGATAATWGSVTEELARIGRVIIYDRRGYARSGGEPALVAMSSPGSAAPPLPRRSRVRVRESARPHRRRNPDPRRKAPVWS